MKYVSIGSMLLVLLTCLLITVGCAMDRHPSRTDRLPEAFVLNLEDPCDYHPLLTGKPQTSGMRSARVRLEPGQSVGRHDTHAHEELLVFLSGVGTALIGESTRLPVGVGEAAYIPAHTAHDIVNTGTAPLVYVFCVAPISDR